MSTQILHTWPLSGILVAESSPVAARATKRCPPQRLYQPRAGAVAVAKSRREHSRMRPDRLRRELSRTLARFRRATAKRRRARSSHPARCPSSRDNATAPGLGHDVDLCWSNDRNAKTECGRLDGWGMGTV